MLKNILKISIAVLGISAACASFAADDGLYAGGQIGQAKTKGDTGTGGRVLLGYQFNKYLAAETGFTMYPSVTKQYPLYKEKYEKDTVDFSGKVMLPIGEKFNVYGKAGVAAVDATNTKTWNSSGNSNEKSSTNGRVLYGFGVSYDINKKLTTDLSWTQQPGVFSADSTLTALGLTYHFK